MSYPPPQPQCASGSALLRIAGLTVTHPGLNQSPALAGIDLQIAPGEVVGILGESGCGKTTLAMAILGLLAAGTRVEGSIRFHSLDLAGLPERQLRTIRGAKISLIHQEPGLCLSPVMSVGAQIAEVIRAHRNLSRKLLREEVEAVLHDVHLSDVCRIARAYPHQLSGGELSRVVIAQALACRPALIIADEPTRSLDVRLQFAVLELLRDINQRCGAAILLIAHNPALLAGFANRVVVMQDGRVVEAGTTQQLFRHPQHAYTRTLLQLAPHSLPVPQNAGFNSAVECLQHAH